MQRSKWQWARPPKRKAAPIPWYFFVSLGLCCGTVAGQVFLMHYAQYARREVQAAREDIRARTLTLEPQERIQITMEGRSGSWVTAENLAMTTPAYGHIAVMDPSCQVHRQQEPQPGERLVWQGQPRVVTDTTGAITAVVTHESITELPSAEKGGAMTHGYSH